METTFITIHDLGPEARILYSSDSVVDILGYQPDEIVDKSCWEFFHPEELPLARTKHGRTVEMDKAAVLSYCRMRARDGGWVGCEVVFTVVYDVLVGCTSIYKAGINSQNRAAEAPMVRRLFSSSPRDPRYHMLSHLSTKFTTSPKTSLHEPRAALFLNRYTRTLTIMYATEGLADILGISGDDLRGRSFYFCIAESCLADAVRCLETAKQNDSIAYLRFWYRDPRSDDASHVQMPTDDDRTQSGGSENDASGQPLFRHNDSDTSIDSQPVSSTESNTPAPTRHSRIPPRRELSGISRTSSDESNATHSHHAIFGERQFRSSSSTSDSDSPIDYRNHGRRRSNGPVELEAVVSCTSDGMVVCLRKARPMIPGSQQGSLAAAQAAAKPTGLFAAPWASSPILPHLSQRIQAAHPNAFAPALAPAGSSHLTPSALPAGDDFMDSIRDCAVFAWGITGINGTLVDYGIGKPRGEAQPPAGYPIWDPSAHAHLQVAENATYPPADQLASRHRERPCGEDTFGDSGIERRTSTQSQNLLCPNGTQGSDAHMGG